MLTEGSKGIKGAVEEAEKIVQKIPNAFMRISSPILQTLRFIEKPPHWRFGTTPMERLMSFVAGVGTGGTITGVSEVLKEKKPGLITVAIEPAGSPVLSGGAPGPHKIQGIGAGFIPGNLNLDIIDEVVKVENEEAFEASRALARDEGILCGISSGAAFYGAKILGSRAKNRGKNVVFIICDTGERYLSTELVKTS